MKRVVREQFALQSAPDAVMARLLDYSHYADWFPEVTQSSLLVQEGDVSVIEVFAPEFSAQPIDIEVVKTGSNDLRFQRSGKTRDAQTAGELRLRASEQGSVLDIELHLSFPWFRQPTAGREIAVLKGAAKALDMDVTARSRTPAERKLIMEVRRNGDGYEVWYQGHVFPLSEFSLGELV